MAGIGIGASPIFRRGHRGVTPLDYANLVAWWPTHPSLGTVTLVQSAARDPSLWSLNNIASWTTGHSDPDGGSDAYLMVEPSDLNTYHYVRDANPTNGIASYWDLDVWLKPAGRTWAYVGTSAANGLYVDLTNHVTGNALGDFSGSFVEASGDWSKWHIESRELSQNFQIYCSLANDNRYDGDGASGVYVYGAEYTQTRIQQVADQGPNGAHRTQLTIDLQPLFWAETLGGIVVPWSEYGRTSYLQTANAAVCAAAGGDDPAFAVIGIYGEQIPAGAASNNTQPIRWDGAGGETEIPFRHNSTGITSRRDDGITNDSNNWPVHVSNDLATAVAFAFICNTDRTRELWIAGALDTLTMSDLTSIAFTTCSSGHPSLVTTGTIKPDCAVFSGQTPGATAADRYAYYQPALATLAGLYGGLTT